MAEMAILAILNPQPEKIMGITLSELFTGMNSRGLTFRATATGDVEVVGDDASMTDALRRGVIEHQAVILACLPAASPAAAPDPKAVVDEIRRQLDEFGLWLGRFAVWARPKYLDSIDLRIAEAVDMQDPAAVALQIEAIRQEVEGINWASEILPRAYETEAKHAAAAEAGPAGDAADLDEVPF